MGIIGRKLGAFVGGAIGKWAGGQIQRRFKSKLKLEDLGESVGGDLGGFGGALLPFKKGGKIKKTGPAYMHSGEFVLPKGVKPTKKQVSRVRKRGGVVT